MTDSNGNGKPSAFEPPQLPDQKKLDAAVLKLARMSPEEIMRRSVATGIHSTVAGGLTADYQQPGDDKKITRY
jgi:hypothetical protein